ncbi:MAG: AAA family ATPase, partial [Pseudomonadota bacterium]
MVPLFFNQAGPSEPELNYMIDPLTRINLPHIERLIAQRRYFVLHAPRQTGKTTCLMALMAHLNQQGDYRALYANIEPAQAWRNNIPEAMRTICYLLARDAQRELNDNIMLDQAETVLQQGAGQALTSLLSLWAQQSQQPTVLFLDEVDALVGDTLISVLRQIRGGYT